MRSGCRHGVTAVGLSPRGVHVTFGVLLTRSVTAHWFAAPRTTFASLAGRGPSGLSLPAAPAVIVRMPPPSSRGLRSPPGYRPDRCFVGLAHARHRRSLSWGSLPYSACGEMGPAHPGFPHPAPSAFGVSTPWASCSPSRLPPIFQGGALLGFSLQGFLPLARPRPLSQTRSFLAFHEATGTVLGSMDRWNRLSPRPMVSPGPDG